jgi:hypothetical protein
MACHGRWIVHGHTDVLVNCADNKAFELCCDLCMALRCAVNVLILTLQNNQLRGLMSWHRAHGREVTEWEADNT